jgi:hypothetical protein
VIVLKIRSKSSAYRGFIEHDHSVETLAPYRALAITKELINANFNEFDKTQYLTDGGVFDNLGLHELHRIATDQGGGWQALLVSDAGGNFDWSIDNKYAFIVSRNVRATNILMDRVSKLVPSVLIGQNPPLCHVYIGKELSPDENSGCLPAEVQRGVRNIRTDLDCFSRDEITSLIKHGYDEARWSLLRSGLVSVDIPPFDWEVMPDAKAGAMGPLNFQDTKRRKLGLFTVGDPASWTLLVIVLCWLTLFLWNPFVQPYLDWRAVDVRFSGIVVDEQDRPVPDAIVSLESPLLGRIQTQSFKSGKFLVTFHDPERYRDDGKRAATSVTITAQKNGRRAWHEDIHFHSEADIKILMPTR